MSLAVNIGLDNTILRCTGPRASVVLIVPASLLNERAGGNANSVIDASHQSLTMALRHRHVRQPYCSGSKMAARAISNSPFHGPPEA